MIPGTRNSDALDLATVPTVQVGLVPAIHDCAVKVTE